MLYLSPGLLYLVKAKALILETIPLRKRVIEE